MNEIILSPWVVEFIKSHATSQKKEIYGWLIGYEHSQGTQYVISTIPCQRYIQQEYSHATPDPIEFQEIASFLPHGLGILGIYHSHPDTVFHSGIDDQTLQNFSKMYPKIISGVSNGDVIKWYRNHNENIVETDIIEKNIHHNYRTIVLFTQIHLRMKLNVEKPAIPQVITHITDNFDTAFLDAEFSIKKTEILQILHKNTIFNHKSDLSDSIGHSISLSPLAQGNNHLSVLLSINDPIIDTNAVPIAKFSLIGLIYIDIDSIDIDTLKVKIKSELFDEIISFISRSYISPQPESKAKIITPSSILLSYPNSILKLRLITEAIKTSKVPQTLITTENSQLISSRKKFVELYRGGKKSEARDLLLAMKKIYEIREQTDEIKNVDTVLQLIEKI